MTSEQITKNIVMDLAGAPTKKQSEPHNNTKCLPVLYVYVLFLVVLDFLGRDVIDDIKRAEQKMLNDVDEMIDNDGQTEIAPGIH